MLSNSTRFVLAVSATIVLTEAGTAQLQASLESPATIGPATRDYASTYDASRDVTVLFAGERSGFLQDDVWEWDGVNWANRSFLPRPGPRRRPAFAYDPVRGHSVAFGGRTPSSVFLSDTWVYDGSGFSARTSPVTPPPRSGAWATFDPVRQVVVMFGGFVPTGQDTNDTWEWNGSAWAQRTPATVPAARGAHRMVWDGTRQAIVMFGGFRTPLAGTVNDTWQWDGANWSAITGASTPQRRCDQTMVFDEQRQRVFMFAGLTAFTQPGNVPVTLNDCWVLEPNGWQSKTVPGTPPSRAYTLGEYDAANEQIVMHGGFASTGTFSDTYTVESLSPADMQAYGAGCPGGNGVPVLSALSLPWSGDDYTVEVTNVPQTTAGFLVLGLSDTNWNGQPVPVDLTSFGLAGCNAWLSADLSVFLFVQNGAGRWDGSVCNCTWAAGIGFSLQAVVLDAGAPTQLSASMSNALRGTIGVW